MQLLHELSGQALLEFNCSITPQAGDRAEKTLDADEEETYVLHLPVVRSISAHATLGDKDHLSYMVRIDNFKRKQEFVWVKLFDEDVIGEDDIKFKVRGDGAYQSWNLMRIQRSDIHHIAGSNSNVYEIKIPLKFLDVESLNSSFGHSDLVDKELELTIKLGYFAEVGNGSSTFDTEYWLKEDLSESRSEIEFPKNHDLLK